MHSTEAQQAPANIRDVFEVLSGDLNICFAPLQQSMESPDEEGNYTFDGTAARTYVNMAFACIASAATCMRQWAMWQLQCDADYAEQFSSGDELTPLEKAIRIGFGLLDQISAVDMEAAGWHGNQQWWLSLQRAIEIKYRLASPVSPADLEISAEELMTVVDAEAGFRLRLAAYLEEPAPVAAQINFVSSP